MGYSEVGQSKSVQFLEGAGSGSLVAKIAQFLKGTSSWLLGAWQQKLHSSWTELVVGWLELLVGKTTLMLGGSPANQFCAFFYLSVLLCSRGLAHEIYAIF